MSWRDRFLFGSVWDNKFSDWLELAPGSKLEGRRGHEAAVDSVAIYSHPRKRKKDAPEWTLLLWLREGFDLHTIYVAYETAPDDDEYVEIEVFDVVEIDPNQSPPLEAQADEEDITSTHPHLGELEGGIARMLEPVRIEGPRATLCPVAGHVVVFEPTSLNLSELPVLYDEDGRPRMAFGPRPKRG